MKVDLLPPTIGKICGPLQYIKNEYYNSFKYSFYINNQNPKVAVKTRSIFPKNIVV